MEIRLLSPDEIGAALTVIHAGFLTAANEFGLTKENCPTNGAFLPMERLRKDWEGGVLAAGSFERGRMTGYAQVRMTGDRCAELEKLCVLPEDRHAGAGAALVKWAEKTAADRGAQKLCIGIIEENARLKAWYTRLGFVHMGTQRFAFLPFTVGFMEKSLSMH